MEEEQMEAIEQLEAELEALGKLRVEEGGELEFY